MKISKAYYKYLDILRIILCLAVLFYHLDYLKGGYLAVCSFFTLSGYLACHSASSSEKFPFKKYYLSRLLKLYLPLVIVTFITIPIVLLFKDIIWINIKPETISVLGGYNNFWQISANLDYFAGSIESPFIHLWYVAILFQLELIFPFIYILFKKLGTKINKHVPIISLLLLTIASIIYFYYTSMKSSLMVTYYHTLSRAFSFLLGVTLGFVHNYNKQVVIPKLPKLVFYIYLLGMGSLFIFVPASSKCFALAMILTSLITCRLISYATSIETTKETIITKIIKSFSSVTYNIYLIQYPLIFLSTQLTYSKEIKTLLIIVTTIILAYFLYYILKRPNKFKILNYSLKVILLLLTIYGMYKFAITKDYRIEMQALEEELEANTKLSLEKQKAYQDSYRADQEQLNALLETVSLDPTKLTSAVENLSIVGVGDSIMLGAVPNLYAKFPNGYFDAKISRTAWVANGILVDLKNKNMLGNPIVLNLGANGDCPYSCKREILNTCSGRDIFWVNVTNDRDVHVNSGLNSLAASYPNLHIIDWASTSRGHPEYFIADGIHLTPEGVTAYVNTIFSSIYNLYQQKYQSAREEIIKNHDEKVKNKITFYGNDLLLNNFTNLEKNYPESNFVVDTSLTPKTLMEKLISQEKDNTLTNTLVFAFDKTFSLTSSDLKKLKELCNNHTVYYINTTKNNLDLSPFKVIDFSKELVNNPDYLLADRIHLNEKGNKKLVQLILKELPNKSL